MGLRATICCLLVAVWVAAVSPWLVAAPEGKTVLKLGTVAPKNTPWARVLGEFSSAIAQDSGGKLAVEVGYGGVLGGERELLHLCREGKVALIGVSTTIVAEVAPELNVLEMPYLFHSHTEVDYITENVVGPAILPKLESLGLILLFWSENGFKSLATVRPVRSLADMRGLAVRSQQSAVYKAIFEALGMVTLPLGVNEVSQGLQSGLIQGFDNSPLFTYTSGLHYYARYYTLTEHSFQPVMLLASKKVLDGLPAQAHSALFANRARWSQQGREAIREGQRQALKSLAASGVTIYEPTLDERAAYLAATRPVYARPATLLGESGAALLEQVQAALVNLRKLK